VFRLKMNKEQVIEILQHAHEDHQTWVRHGQILIDGLNLENAIAPVKCTDCEFGLWFYAEGTELQNFAWYKEIKEIHDKTHESYNVLYFESMRMYNPKTRTELIKRFEDLEKNSSELLGKLEETQEYLSNILDTEFEEQLLENTNEEPVSEAEITKEESIEDSLEKKAELKMQEIDINFMDHDKDKSIESQSNVQAAESKFDPSGQRQILKQQYLKQMEQEKELTQLELNQLKERQKLIEQGVEQLQQYYQLKNQEIELDLLESNELETRKLEVSNYKQEDLDLLNKQIQKKLLELDQLEMVDQKLEKKKLQEEQEELQQIIQIEELKQNKLTDIKQLQKQLDLRKSDLEKLKEQVRLVEQDINELEEQQEEKNEDIAQFDEQIALKSQEHEEQSQRQQKLDKHKHEVQQEKQHELGLLEQQQKLRKDELKDIKQELRDLSQKRTEDQMLKQKELRDIEEQQELKSHALEKIEKEQQKKNDELRRLGHKIEETQENLESVVDSSLQSEDAEQVDLAEG